MANYFRVIDSVEALPGVKVIKAKDVPAIAQVEELLTEAEKVKEGIIAEAKQFYQSELERGYQEGLEKAKQEKVKAVNAATMKTAEFTKNMEKNLSEIVQSILTKVLGHFEKKELVLQLVKSTIKDYTKSQKIRVMVNPEHADYFNTHIEAIIEQHPVIEFIEILPDFSVEVSGCIIDTQSEMIFMSIEDQLAAIKEMMQQASQG